MKFTWENFDTKFLMEIIEYHNLIKEVVIEEGITEIPDNAFYDDVDGNSYNYLEKVTIPDSVTKIGYDAFYGLTSLTTLNYSGNAEIEEGAFTGCAGLADGNGFVIVGNILFGYHNVRGIFIGHYPLLQHETMI